MKGQLARLTPRSISDVLSLPAPSLAAFTESTLPVTLDPWQIALCERLEALRYQTGQRILIHAPPQAGKSVIVSQRFPAWLLGVKPSERVKLACYNITHATRFSGIVRGLMQSPEFHSAFPSPDSAVPALSAKGEWSTAARAATKDGQPSFMAMGLLSGFVGQGASTLLVDDPYASPQDALSPVIRESVWTFWEDGARVRLFDDANVVVMFHRYHQDDFAGRLIEREGLIQNGGRWEMLRFAAVADGDESFGPDPMGRAEGERLSPRYSDEYLATQQEGGSVWLSQFQGRPTSKEGSFFKVAQIAIEPAAPAILSDQCRAWDMAATEGGGDYTAGVLMARAPDGIYWILDVRRGRWATDTRNREIVQAAALDGTKVRIHGPQDPGAAGKDAAAAFTRMLAGYSVKTEPVSGAKTTRADPFSAQVNAGNVRMVKAEWNKVVIEELRGFPLGAHDDCVDALSDSFTELASGSTSLSYQYTYRGAKR